MKNNLFKKVIAIGLIALLICSTGLFKNVKIAEANTANTFKNPMGDIKSASIPFNIDVLTEDDTSFLNIKKSDLPAQLNLVSSKQINARADVNAVWVLEDQFNEALDKTTDLHSKLNNIAHSGKPVVFLGCNNPSIILTAFKVPFKEVPDNNSIKDSEEQLNNSTEREYKTVAVWVQYDKNGLPTVGNIVIPNNYEVETKDVLEATWIYRNGVTEVRKNSIQVENKQISYSSEPETLKTLDAASVTASTWGNRGNYVYYALNKP